jgi:hypothetical protein
MVVEVVPDLDNKFWHYSHQFVARGLVPRPLPRTSIGATFSVIARHFSAEAISTNALSPRLLHGAYPERYEILRGACPERYEIASLCLQ